MMMTVMHWILTKISMRKHVCTVKIHPCKCKSDAMNATHISAINATGVMSTNPTMKFAYVTGAMPFTVAPVMKWINAMTVEKLCVALVRLCSRASFVEADSAKTVQLLAEGTWFMIIFSSVSLLNVTSLERALFVSRNSFRSLLPRHNN